MKEIFLDENSKMSFKKKIFNNKPLEINPQHLHPPIHDPDGFSAVLPEMYAEEPYP